MNAAKPIAVTCGDPAGVGPEILSRLLEGSADFRTGFVFIGPKYWVETLPAPGEPVGPEAYRPAAGKPDTTGAEVAWEALRRAADGCRRGDFGGVVTGPVSKHQLALVGYPYPGQTEFFADAWRGTPVMGFVGREMVVTLATWHIPLAEVPRRLEAEPALVERSVAEARRLLGRMDRQAQCLGVCGLNPHAGESGMLGREEVDWLAPRLRTLGERYGPLEGPLPGDTAFVRMRRGELGAVVAMYHDQGLGPLKAVEFDQAVNVTLGLDFVRTSPDHGTAFAIAGQGVAETGSFAAALELCRTWCRDV